MSLISPLKQKQTSNVQDSLISASDGQLVASFLKEKNEQAFARIVSRYGEMVFAVALRAVRHRQTAEDVTQATFLVLARDAKKIRHAGSLGAWLHGVALRLARKALKRCHKEKVNDVVNELEIAQESFEEIHSAFEQQVLDEELQGLPDQYRDALVLHFLQGLTYEETAQQLGLTIGAVEGRIKRGKRELHLRLSKRGVGLTVALAAITWSQTAAAATVQPALVQTIAASGLAVFQGTAFPAACSSEAVYLAAKEFTMFTAAKMTILTCGLMLAAGAGWAVRAGVGDDETSSTGGFGEVGTVVDDALDSQAEAGGGAVIAQQSNESDDGLSGSGIISGDGTTGLETGLEIGNGSNGGLVGGASEGKGYSPEDRTALANALNAFNRLQKQLRDRNQRNGNTPDDASTLAIEKAVELLRAAIDSSLQTTGIEFPPDNAGTLDYGSGIISGDGTSGVISQSGYESTFAGGGAYGAEYGNSATSFGGIGAGSRSRKIPVTKDERKAMAEAVNALVQLRNQLQHRKDTQQNSAGNNEKRALDQTIADVNIAIQSAVKASKTFLPPEIKTPDGQQSSWGGGEMMSNMAGMMGMGGGYGMSAGPGGDQMGSPMSGQAGKPLMVSRTMSPQEQKIVNALDQVSQFEFPGNPLSDIFEFIRVSQNIPIIIDEVALSEEGISPEEEEVELILSEVTLKSALHLLLKPLELDYVVEDDVMKITTKYAAAEMFETRIYDVRSMNIKRPEALADVIVYGTGQDTWSSGGGKGEISFLNGSVIIRQTARVHDEVEKLLENLAKIELANQNSPEWPAKNRPPQNEEEDYGMGMMGDMYGGGYAGGMGYGQSYRGSWDNVQKNSPSSRILGGSMSGDYEEGSAYGSEGQVGN